MFAVFKFNPPKGFCKYISWLFLRGNEVDSNGIVFNFLTGEMIVNFEVLGFFVEYGVITKFNAALIVTVKISGLAI